jgi:hypothetical protein
MVFDRDAAAAAHRPEVGRGIGGLAEEVKLNLKVRRIDEQALNGQPRVEGKVLTAPDKQGAMRQWPIRLLVLEEWLCHGVGLPCRRDLL